MLVRSFLLLALLALVPLRQGDKQASAYTVLISEKDELRQSCSGVKAGKDSHIEGTTRSMSPRTLSSSLADTFVSS